MNYKFVFSDQAKADIAFFKQSGQKAIVNKIKRLLHDIQEHPYSGIGKPELLKYDLGGIWSRRITDKDRITYRVYEEKIIIDVLSSRGHYE